MSEWLRKRNNNNDNFFVDLSELEVCNPTPQKHPVQRKEIKRAKVGNNSSENSPR